MRTVTDLFCEDSLDRKLRGLLESARSRVDHVPLNNFLVSSDQELIDHVVARFTVDPLVLRDDAASMNQFETRIDVSNDPLRAFFSEGSGPIYTAGTRVEVRIPFTGDEWLFRFRTNPYFTSLPQAVVTRGTIEISISLAHDEQRERFNEIYKTRLKLLKKYVSLSHQQVTSYNESLPNAVKQAIAIRRDRLKNHSDIATILEIPPTPKAGVPPVTPVPIRIRRPRPLPEARETGLTPEPSISDETYEHILHFIRHQGRTFERSPATYSVHNEEDLRNIILAQINGHFEGGAVGEAFRKRGRTDISIEADNRAAFVGECKFWAGPDSLGRALSQLLGYLTWRDSKASLILFNSRNKDFSNILQSLPITLRKHPLFVRDIPCEENGEWRIQMCSETDKGRRVTVHIFLFDLYQAP